MPDPRPLLTKLSVSGFPGVGEEWSGEYYRADEVDARLTEVEGERDERAAYAQRMLELAGRWEAENNTLAAENARLRQQRDRLVAELAEKGDHAAFEALNIVRLELSAKVDELKAERDQLRVELYEAQDTPADFERMAELEAAEAERDTMRPVVEAAKTWRHAGVWDADHPFEAALEAIESSKLALVAAVDTYHKAQTEALVSPLSPSEPELVPDSTDGVGEQGEAQGVLREANDRADIAIAALATLVDLKDGPRDAGYRSRKEAAWDRARWVVLGFGEPIDRSSIHSEGGSDGTWPELTHEPEPVPYVQGRFGKPVDLMANLKASFQKLRDERILGGREPWTGEGCCRSAFESEGNRHDHPPTETDQPADPPWLEEANEAGRAAYDSVVIAHGAFGHRAGHHDAIIAAIRAALPLIAAGVLGDLADDLETSRWLGYQSAAQWIRERAARQVTT